MNTILSTAFLEFYYFPLNQWIFLIYLMHVIDGTVFVQTENQSNVLYGT